VQPDYVLYKLVRTDETANTISSSTTTTTPTDMLPTPNTQQKKETAANALIEMLGPQQPQQKPGMPQIGERVKILWPSLDTYFYGTVEKTRGDFYFIFYDDDETQWLPLADHNFKIVSPDEGEAASPSVSRCDDPRWNDSSPLRGNKKSPPSSPEQSNDDASEMEWKGNIKSGGNKAKAKKQKAQSVPKSQAVKTETKTRFMRNGCWFMKQPPKKDGKGFYLKPTVSAGVCLLDLALCTVSF